MTASPTTYRDRRHGPRPLDSITASARRITGQQMTRRGWGQAQSWQEDAWEMFDLIGELRFLATTLAARMGRAQLFVGKLPDDPTEDPILIEDESISTVLDSFGGTPTARGQLVTRLGINLFVAGDGWLVGIPRVMLPRSLRLLPEREDAAQAMTTDGASPDRLMIRTAIQPGLTPRREGETAIPGTDDAEPRVESMPVDALEWRMLSVSEVVLTGSGEVQLKLGAGPDEIISCRPEDIFLIRVWRSHPRRWWEADSPTRSSLPVMRQLVGLTMRTGAEIDSRLAGAGILVLPSTAARALKVAMGLPEDSDEDPFTDALIEAMVTPIRDRSSASAVVPLVATVPDETAELIRHLSFASPLDEHSAERVEEALRRIALGLDAPPETLLGTSSMNHWGAWLVQDDVVSTHLEPPLALICDALTTQYLWPVLLEQGMSPEQVREHVIWYDVSHLVVRPTASADALVLHDRGVISDAAVRSATGFDDADAPMGEGEKSLPIEVVMALDLVAKSPTLMSTPGLPKVVAQLRAVLQNRVPDIPDEDLIPKMPAALAPPSGPEDGDGEDGDDEDQPAGPLPQPGPPSPPGFND